MKKLFIKIKNMHKAFVVAVLMNAAVGAADMVVGILFITGAMNFLYNLFPFFAEDIEATGAFYFFSHGIIKLLLSWNLLQAKLWAYPVAIAFFSVFSIYQIIDLLSHFSWFVSILFVVNFAVLIMVIIEYRRIKKILCATELVSPAILDDESR